MSRAERGLGSGGERGLGERGVWRREESRVEIELLTISS